MRRSPPPGFEPEGLAPPPLADGPWPVASIALDVSGECNLACRYCAERATQPARPPMSESVLQDAWGFFASRPTPKGRSIHLGSGEPLLAMPILRSLDRLVREANDPSLSVHLTTNGTLTTPDVRDWLVESGWHIKVSLDGPATVQDRWRPHRSGEGTYSQVAETVVDLARRLSPSRFSVTAVLCRGSDPQEVLDDLVSLGVRRIQLIPVAHDREDFLPSSADIQRYERFIMRHARRHLESESWDDIPRLPNFRTPVFRLMGLANRRTSCGAGRSFVSIGPDGSIFPCFRLAGIDRYRIGRLQDGIDAAEICRFQRDGGRPYEERAACGRCWLAPLCGGPCFAVAEMFGPGGGRPLDLHYAYRAADATAAVWLVQQLRLRDPDRLLEFFPEDVLDALADSH